MLFCEIPSIVYYRFAQLLLNLWTNDQYHLMLTIIPAWFIYFMFNYLSFFGVNYYSVIYKLYENYIA